MLWIPLAIGSYFLSALASVIDKILLRGRVTNPLAFAFYTGIASIGVLILIPFGFSFLSFTTTLFAFLAGGVFLASLLFLYTALRYGEASRVVPLIGALTPLVTLGISYFTDRMPPPRAELLAIFFFVVGGLLISFDMGRRGKSRFNGFILFVALLSAIAMGSMFELSKVVYSRAPFFPGFIWMRMGSFLASLLMLFVPAFRASIFSSVRTLRVSSGGILLFNKVLGAVAFLVLNYAVSLGNESVVSAMRGFEFLFVFAVVYLLSRRLPHILKESFDARVLLYKITGIVLIGVGFYSLLYS